jgi:hypothetical protein
LDTVSFLSVTFLQLTDTVIELAGRLILDTVGTAKCRTTTFAAEWARSYKDIVEEIKRVAMNPGLSDQAARAHIVELCNQPSDASFPTHAATVRPLPERKRYVHPRNQGNQYRRQIVRSGRSPVPGRPEHVDILAQFVTVLEASDEMGASRGASRLVPSSGPATASLRGPSMSNVRTSQCR